MSISEKHIELFESYRNGDLTEVQLKEFDARLSYDSEFKIEFEKYQSIEEGIKTHYRNELKNKLQELDLQLDLNQNKKSKVNKILIWTSSIAAVFIVGFLILRQSNNIDELQIAKEYWPHEEGLPVKMSSKGKYDDAMNAFKLEQFDEATKLLHQINSDTADYYLGVIAHNQNKFQQSENFFLKIKSNSKYYDEAQLRLALVLIMNKKSSEARKILQNQTKNKSEFAELAQEILDKLRK